MYLICNHKNNLTYNEVRTLKEKLKTLDTQNINLIISPSYPYIYSFIRYTIASQDISVYDDNKTGEVSGKQLKSLFVDYVIIGHVERRKYFNDNIDVLVEKIKNAHNNGLKVIYCFTSYNTDVDSSYDLIKEEYEHIKNYIDKNDLIAFEPEWAIGNVKNLNYEYINKVIDYIYKLTNRKVIYGGSVNNGTVDNLLTINNLEGFLVSTISNDIGELQIIINKMT